MKLLRVFLILTLLISCQENNKQNTYQVKYKGALKNIMHKGDLSAKATLKDFENTKHLYALGAIENLKGEIQIFNSKSFNTSVIDNLLVFNNSFDKKATLFVYASVSKWKTILIPETIITYEQLEIFIAKTASKNKINIKEPFPFLIEGTPKLFDWHVINWKDGDTEHSHEKHVNSGLHGTKKGLKVEMLGFYSDSHHAIFTHHTTNMHIHVKTVNGKLAGHVDGLTLGKRMVLKLPEVE